MKIDESGPMHYFRAAPGAALEVLPNVEIMTAGPYRDSTGIERFLAASDLIDLEIDCNTRTMPVLVAGEPCGDARDFRFTQGSLIADLHLDHAVDLESLRPVLELTADTAEPVSLHFAEVPAEYAHARAGTVETEPTEAEIQRRIVAFCDENNLDINRAEDFATALIKIL